MKFAQALLVIAASTLPVSAQSPDEVKEVAGLIIEQAECRSMIIHWNAGIRGDIERRYGRLAEDYVQLCWLGLPSRKFQIDEYLEKYPDALNSLK
ncbi:hypothetical protein KZZ07_19775 [Mameliella sp. CS4]|uniref:hypothetical protein n=1 Tax=Mameliella sp. CS4 TaxID=2862329 RepID=UPI001C5FF631|nr:hypothetical protein [Mameliella sp. CS4]MBW4984784.1 hypothetical protein [Mameliella sp. CS4]